MFRYAKSNAKQDKLKTQDFQMPVNCICEEKVIYELITLHYQGTFPWGGQC